MKCTLMHKKIAVALIEIDDATGFIKKIETVYMPKHLPTGIPFQKGIADRTALNAWWTDRSIPASRSGIRDALETLEITNTKMLLLRCYGLSLSDQYWICPLGSNLTWDDINFFHHDFSEDIGDILFGEKKKADGLNLSSPDNTSDGNLKKRWKIINGKRCLIKGGSNPFRQQPFNEVIASEIMERLDIPHVPYTVTWNKGAPYSICEDFVDENTDLVTAWRIIQCKKRSNSTSVYHHFIDCCRDLGIRDVIPFLDRMLVLDYIIVNEDRHLNNFGALRNAETLEWIGMAPVYDSGSSLGYDKVPVQMGSEENVICKPFKNHHDKQIQLVSSFDWINFDRLTDVDQMITDILSAENAKDYMDDHRIQVIARSVRRRIENLSRLSDDHKSKAVFRSEFGTASEFGAASESGKAPAHEPASAQIISTEDDVAENVAADYGADA